ncbi:MULTISPECIES: ArsR/SmtB family transcription factor [Aminobacter]|jgi:DNA-binding transcriptional ArsR family regulator|uniref:DNA-binding transcriptional ArsR family regulator n=1 Tax=Aminobacter ciceronei TaxID=150723 RepID=A0ABR6C3B8_9HYPH|nr:MULTISPECIES: metalloregulator ArsR/SmtB family transcription factor [Aminobacter]WMC96359.1 metalloregulator ArsR/SmtB family transcription factor [Aminobacter aminovorans]MBA8905681.1 DNA-binding transcriptional ArsR family regulator [Aminobacter ciceronei]MBA9019460.1 DNA-binding transcriptional ArsR family regulator [Aminobacter ciceronei]MRX34486.1 metalloregulator ArsR/SmtB family transcription factor [Aminobacter sp. MDW-2]QNH35909.1 winged helix-turn-helix transcriptional regulator 
MTEPQDAIFRALSDPTRRGLFERLCRNGDTTVVGLLGEAGVSQPVVSKHLKILKTAGLVRDRQQGRYTYYSVERDALRTLIDWTSEMSGFWNDRFDDLDNLLKRMDQ